MLRKNTLRKFVAIRDALREEKVQLEARLAEINGALEEAEVTAPARRVVRRRKKRVVKRRGRRRLKNEMSLREAVLKVLAKGPLGKKEILQGVQKLGYRFSGKDPMNRLGVLLYSKKPRLFKNAGGKFSPA